MGFHLAKFTKIRNPRPVTIAFSPFKNQAGSLTEVPVRTQFVARPTKFADSLTNNLAEDSLTTSLIAAGERHAARPLAERAGRASDDG